MPNDFDLAESFARRVARWAREGGASAACQEAVFAATRVVSRATAAGNVCCALADIVGDRGDDSIERTVESEPDAVEGSVGVTGLEAVDGSGTPTDTSSLSVLRAQLLASGLVGTPEAPGGLPLIIDADQRLYLHRYFDYEVRLALRLRSLAAGNTAPGGIGQKAADAKLGQLVATLFPGGAASRKVHPQRVDWQMLATALALIRPLLIISGGPGTGKTTTIVKILAATLARDPNCRIALAAPTGKAAMRMRDAIKANATHLPAGLCPSLPTEATTIHRLLGVTGETGEFRHNAENPLALDLLVVDESSMLDLALATKLLEAVPRTGRVILLGDKDQLAAVEAGAIFAELSAFTSLSPAYVKRLAALTGATPEQIASPQAGSVDDLVDSVVWLTESFRFNANSGIGRLAALINAGDAEGAMARLRAGEDDSVSWLDDATYALEHDTQQRILDGYDAYAKAVRNFASDADHAAVFKAFEEFRVLCAERVGPRGVVGLNAWIERSLRARLDEQHVCRGRSEWYVGRPVIIRANDYTLRLFNGDVGIALSATPGQAVDRGSITGLQSQAPASGDAEAILVWFADDTGVYRPVAPVRLPPHEAAFATTVHKAQGSEFEQVMLILPARSSQVATRELVYTAITRSRGDVTIVGSADVLVRAIAVRTVRRSGLVARIQALQSS